MTAEHEAAYQIDFHLAESRNWMVIHDPAQGKEAPRSPEACR